MMQVRQICLIGDGMPPASVEFVAGANVISGASDTGKSYMLRCMDFALGAEKMTKIIEQSSGYETVMLELENTQGEFLTLSRHLTGGDIAIHRTRLRDMTGDGQVVQWKRQGKSKAPDLSSVLLPFSGVGEAQLRSDKKLGKKNRLTIRTLLSVCLVSEIDVIAERSPVYGEGGYNKTSHERMLSYILTGIDDDAVITEERKDIAQARLRGKLSLIEDMLKPIDERLEGIEEDDENEQHDAIERVDGAIENLTSELDADRKEQLELQQEHSLAFASLQRTDVQLLAIDELVNRYRLLDTRYETDLNRLDFLSDGAHFFEQLQDARCPLCHKPMTSDHEHQLEAHFVSSGVYEATKAEAAKILSLKTDLKETMKSLETRRDTREDEKATSEKEIQRIDNRLTEGLAPRLKVMKTKLDELIQHRFELEVIRTNREQAEELRTLQSGYEDDLKPAPSAKKKWADIEPSAILNICKSIESVLKDWSWKGDGRVEFDTNIFDIKVDGISRQSHGKGVRAILHSAFLLGLLKYCAAENKPHPGFLVVDSPLTTFKEGRDSVHEETDQIDPGIEMAFWKSLLKITPDIQVIVIDNKEPPESVATGLKYEYFVGTAAKKGERSGFIPTKP